MHLSSEPEPLALKCSAPPELCALVHQMLDKEPSARPGALEVRQIGRAIAIELASAYEEFELTGVEPRAPKAARARPMAAMIIPTDEVVVIDPDALEFGTTELLPVVRKPRWTPDIAPVPATMASQHNSGGRTIAPRTPRDSVAGEIAADPKPR